MKKIIAAISLFLISAYVFAQDVNKLIKQDDVERIIKTLSADDMQGRATFTPGIEKAAQFIESEYKKSGLVPLAGNKDFRQNFTKPRNIPVSASVSINGKLVSADSVYINTTALSVNWTNNSDIQVVKMDTSKNFRSESANYQRSGKKLIVMVDSKFSAILKATKARSKNGFMVTRKNDDQVVVYLLGNFGDVKTFNVSYTARFENSPLFNIAGMIPGKSKPNEYVIFSGHYDHLGILPPVKGDSIANGADDDASGTTAVITLAKYFKKLDNNERSIIFVAFCAEEIGEFGSQYFATQVEPDKVMAMFNIEMIGKASKWGQNAALITGYERSDFGRYRL
jgi:hypothetical protein